jgi:hypothetical protein
VLTLGPQVAELAQNCCGRILYVRETILERHGLCPSSWIPRRLAAISIDALCAGKRPAIRVVVVVESPSRSAAARAPSAMTASRTA